MILAADISNIYRFNPNLSLRQSAKISNIQHKSAGKMY